MSDLRVVLGFWFHTRIRFFSKDWRFRLSCAKPSRISSYFYSPLQEYWVGLKNSKPIINIRGVLHRANLISFFKFSAYIGIPSRIFAIQTIKIPEWYFLSSNLFESRRFQAISQKPFFPMEFPFARFGLKIRPSACLDCIFTSSYSPFHASQAGRSFVIQTQI